MVECLVIGCSGTGKSTFLDRLGSDTKLVPLPTLHPTVGTNIKDIQISRKTVVRLREVGGLMRQTWPKYYKDCKGIIYLGDTSNKMQVCSFQMELIKLLSNRELDTVPILLVLNKCDAPLSTSLEKLYAITRLDKILACATAKVKVIEMDLQTDLGVNEVIQWIKDNCK